MEKMSAETGQGGCKSRGGTTAGSQTILDKQTET